MITNHSTKTFAWQRWHISRPERLNALGTTLAKELQDTLELTRAGLPREIRAIVITAETVTKGDKAIWIAGGDLLELSELRDRKDGGEYARMMRTFCEGLEKLEIPVITIVDGAAIGGGAELALFGDVRFATIRSAFEFKQLKLGLVTGYGSANRLIALVGKSKAQALLYFSQAMDAQTAYHEGLIHQLISSASLDDISQAILPIICLEPDAIAAQKKMFRLATTQPTAETNWADEIFESIWMNPTHAKSLAAFRDR